MRIRILTLAIATTLVCLAGAAMAANCLITGDLKICPGESREMCGPAGMASYEWVGPQGTVVGTDRCLTYNVTGVYHLTIVDANGVETSCSARVVDRILPPKCLIAGTLEICEGGSTELCGPEGSDLYEWTGPGTFSSSARCVIASEPGIYTLTVSSSISGCAETCEVEVVVSTPECSISGDPSFCAGGSSELCGPEGAASYAWTGPNGESVDTRCVDVSAAGTWSLAVDFANACGSQTCTIEVTEGRAAPCEINGDREICAGTTTELCGPEGAGSYAWTGPNGFIADTRCITTGVEGEYTLRVVSGDCESRCKALLSVVPCGGTNCPRTVGFWGRQAEQKNNGSTKFTKAEVTAIAECIDDKSDFLDWGDDAFDRFDAALNIQGRMDQRQQAIRQYVGFLANVCVGELGLIANNGDEISLDLDSPIDCDGLDADDLGDAVAEGDARLAGLEGRSLRNEEVKSAYTDLITCFDGINNGTNIPNVCGGDDSEKGIDDARQGGSTLIHGKSGLADTLLRMAPNPFQGSTTISFSVGRDGTGVQIAVYDLAGRLVRTLTDGSYPAGIHAIAWNGTSDAGSTVARGVYYARAVIGGAASVQRVLFLQ